jgi:hypothetical protein
MPLSFTFYIAIAIINILYEGDIMANYKDGRVRSGSSIGSGNLG